jgi:hypothetical protein
LPAINITGAGLRGAALDFPGGKIDRSSNYHLRRPGLVSLGIFHEPRMGGRNMDRWTIARRALEAQSQLNQNRRS